MTSFAERALSDVPPALLQWFSPAPAPASSLGLRTLAEAALRAPLDGPDIASACRAADRVAVVLSDATRDEPRETFLDLLAPMLDRARTVLVVASGTHAAGEEAIPAGFRDWPSWVHAGQDPSTCVDVGRTGEGTRVAFARPLVEADLVVVTGRIRPHYFAGFSGGAKGVFPGCALAEGILHNHRLKADVTARLGRVEDNRCRLDMEAALRLLPTTVVAWNVLCDVDGAPVAAAAGDPVTVHRALSKRAAEIFTVETPRSSVVVVADRPPVTRTLYQASKLVPPAGPILEAGGTVVVVADCADGVGPLDRVNEGIYRLGVVPQLPTHRVKLVSLLDDAVVRQTYAEPAPLGPALEQAGVTPERPAVLLWRAGEMVTRCV